MAELQYKVDAISTNTHCYEKSYEIIMDQPNINKRKADFSY